MQLAIVAFWAGIIVAVIALINGISAATGVQHWPEFAS